MLKRKNMKIDFRTLLDNQLENILQQKAKEGWILEGIRWNSLQFKKGEPQDVKYQIDYNIPNIEYKEILKEEGYEFIDNFNELYIYKNDNLEAEDLHTDEKTRLNAILKVFSPKYTKTTCLLVFILIALNYFWIDIVFKHLSIGQFFSSFSAFLLAGGLITVILLIILTQVQQYTIKYCIQQKIDKNETNYLPFKICNICLIITQMILYILAIMIIADNLLNGSSILQFLFEFILFFMSISAYQFIATKYCYRIEDTTKRRLATFLVLIVYMIVFVSISSIEFPLQQVNSSIEPYQIKDYSYNQDNSIFVSDQSWAKEDDNLSTSEYECIKTCLNEYVAQEVFKTELVYYEWISRMPSDEEIFEMESFDSDDIPYKSYEEALKVMKVYQNDLVDICYYNDYFFIARKNKQIIISYMKDEKNYIDHVIKHYLK